MVLSYAFCNCSLMPVRGEPTHRAEMTNQLLFGEKAEILEINDNDWARIRSYWDDYIGWCKLSQLTLITDKEYNKPAKYTATNNNNHIEFEKGNQWIPAGSELYGIKGGKITLHNETGKYKGKRVATRDLEFSIDELIHNARLYINAPYLWGGRSIAGIDCSGLIQMAFKMCGKPFPRDASIQSEEGESVDFLQHAQTGDLAFFDNADGIITHVGLLLDNSHILHATDTSGKVVIDKIDPEGIISKIQRKRTHSLRMIKRLYSI